MRYFDEIQVTTINHVYNKLRIPYHSTCGYCGLTSRCNKRYKQKWYHVEERRHTYRDFVGCDWQIEKVDARYPNWKLVSKNKKQWMDKPTWKKHYRRRPLDKSYEIIWNGNDLR